MSRFLWFTVYNPGYAPDILHNSIITARSTPLIETLHWLFQNFRIQWVMQKCTTKHKCKIMETQNVLIH